MPQLTFALAPDGLPVPALVGLDTQAMHDLLAQGRPLPGTVNVRGQFDTGTIVTALMPWVLSRLGAAPEGSTRTLTANGYVVVQLYRISFTLYDPAGATPATFSRTSWLVTDLPQDLPDVDVLFGMDLVRELVLHVNGPSGTFTLEF